MELIFSVREALRDFTKTGHSDTIDSHLLFRNPVPMEHSLKALSDVRASNFRNFEPFS